MPDPFAGTDLVVQACQSRDLPDLPVVDQSIQWSREVAVISSDHFCHCGVQRQGNLFSGLLLDKGDAYDTVDFDELVPGKFHEVGDPLSGVAADQQPLPGGLQYGRNLAVRYSQDFVFRNGHQLPLLCFAPYFKLADRCPDPFFFGKVQDVLYKIQGAVDGAFAVASASSEIDKILDKAIIEVLGHEPFGAGALVALEEAEKHHIPFERRMADDVAAGGDVLLYEKKKGIPRMAYLLVQADGPDDPVDRAGRDQNVTLHSFL